jgi:predicted integral membrane protein DUF2269
VDPGGLLAGAPSTGGWLRFLHVIVAFWFIAGILGRNVVIWRAARSPDVKVVDGLMDTAGSLEMLMVRPGSIAVLLLGLLTAWQEHLPWFESGAYWLPTALLAFLSAMLLIPLVFLPRGRVFAQALSDSRERGIVLPELTTAFRDRAVWFARGYEIVMIAFVISLMVLKPF